LVTPIVRIYVTVGEWWYNTPPAMVAPVQVIGIMGVVFLGWRVGRWERIMGRWFMHRPVTLGVRSRMTEWRDCVTLFTSTVGFLKYLFDALS
jgi:rhomboid-like protein